MAKPGPKVGWAQKLRDDLAYYKARNEALLRYCDEYHRRFAAYNNMSKWQKLLFAIKGGWI